MKKYFGVLLVTALISLAGCAASNVPLTIVEKVGTTVDLDVKAGITLGQPVLGDQDNLVVCYVAIDKVLSAYKISETKDPNGKLFYDLMRFRIIQQVTQQNSKLLQTACAQIAQEVMMAVLTRGQSLQPNIQFPTTVPGIPVPPVVVPPKP